jgi:phosphinothricin acetyltransferase
LYEKEVIRFNLFGNEAIQGYISVLIGMITGENVASIKLFKACGYEKCAHFKEVGQKFNKLLDVVAYQKIIQE